MLHGLPIQPASRGYHVAFHADETNHCPGCGRAAWYVGRMTAECAHCGTALPIAPFRRAEEPVRA